MLQTDYYAYSNRLSGVHPGEKAAFSMSAMIICLALSSPAVSLAVILVMSGMVIVRAGVPWRPYLKLLAVPTVFLAGGCAAVALSFAGGPEGYLFGISLGGVWAGVRPADLDLAEMLFLKSMAAASCLFFLSLTTPVVDLVRSLRKMGVPALFLDLVTLVYRFIFVLADSADRIYTSQASRLGYRNLGTGYSSAGKLAASLFIMAYRRSQLLFTALSARCYTGDLRVLERERLVSAKNISGIIIFDIILVAMALMDGGALFGGFHP